MFVQEPGWEKVMKDGKPKTVGELEGRLKEKG